MWVSKIHHLIEQFVDNDKVVANTLLLQDLEVFREYLHDLVEEKEDFGRIGVFLCQGEDVEVTVTDIEVLWTTTISTETNINDIKALSEVALDHRLPTRFYEAPGAVCTAAKSQGHAGCGERRGVRHVRSPASVASIKRTLIPSWEKHGGTAELSSSASLRRMGNFSTADIGMSPR